MSAVIFDVDGVLIDTPHERAWREALEALMAGEWRPLAAATTYAPERFTTAVYQAFVAGRPRLDGANSVLEYFGVADAARLAGVYAERKQRLIDAFLARGDFEAFPDALRFVVRLRARGMCLGVASSSKNADQFMQRIHLDAFARQARVSVARIPRTATLRDIFNANTCGRDLPHGKPDPAIFVLTAQALGVPPSDCIVVEDAPSGILAAKAGGMLGLGVARHADAALLEAAGADLVVATLDDVAVDAFVTGRLEHARGPADVAAGLPRSRPRC